MPKILSPRGSWLRARRKTEKLTSEVVAQALRIPANYLLLVESYDLYVPPEWAPALSGLGLCDPAGWDPPRLELFGKALRNWRLSVNLRAAKLWPRLGVPYMALMLVEGRDWPVPPDWMPALRDLGWKPGARSTSYQKGSRDPDRKAEAVRMLREGSTLAEVSIKTHACLSALRRWAAQDGLSIPKNAALDWSRPTPA